jgi:F-type H+-transporting ATPase subunit epsilon
MNYPVSLITPDKVCYQGEAKVVNCKSVIGELGIYAGHSAFVGVLEPKPVRIVVDDSNEYTFELPKGGVLQVDFESNLTIAAPIANEI